MFRRLIRYVCPASAIVMALSSASLAAPSRSQPAPKAYSLTYNYRLTVNGTAVKEIVHVYRDGDKAMADITVLPSAKNPKTVRSFSVKNLRTHKAWDWGPGVETCATGSFSGDSWSGSPFMEFPMGFRFPSEWSANSAKISPGMVRMIGAGAALGFKTKVYALAIPGQPKSKTWVEDQYGLILKAARIGKDGRYHADQDTRITQFSTAKPSASVFALGGPCAKSAAAAAGSRTGSSGARAAGTTSGISVPHGEQLEIKWQDGRPLNLRPPEEVAFLLLVNIDNLQDQCQLFLKRYCSLKELVRGMKTDQGVIGLSVNPARDTNCRYAVGISGKEFAISARPTKPALGGWLWIQHEFGHDCYFNPHGPATGKSRKVGDYSSLGGDFTRR